MSYATENGTNPNNGSGSSKELYNKLAEHLDKLPGGFPPSKTGAHIRLLKMLFTPEEAELATRLTLEQEDIDTIAGKAGLSATRTEKMLNEMAKKGLIFSVQPLKGPTLYQAVPWILGINEYQVNKLSEEYLEAFVDYYQTNEPREGSWTTSQFRTIPIEQSIEPTLEVLTYERVEDLIEANDSFAVAPCICRTREKKLGRGCDAPMETCLILGDFADFYVNTGLGRRISKTEMKEIIASANEANLVLNPTNSKRVTAICCCCGCCCGIFSVLKQYPKPAEIIVSSFTAEHKPELCVSCGACLDRCQMQALSEEDNIVSLNPDRCIGCGLCVSTCPTGALSLVRKPESALKEVPATIHDTWYKITEEMSLKR
jgi:electron transport complex protein RnfB